MVQLIAVPTQVKRNYGSLIEGEWPDNGEPTKKEELAIDTSEIEEDDYCLEPLEWLSNNLLS